MFFKLGGKGTVDDEMESRHHRWTCAKEIRRDARRINSFKSPCLHTITGKQKRENLIRYLNIFYKFSES